MFKSYHTKHSCQIHKRRESFSRSYIHPASQMCMLYTRYTSSSYLINSYRSQWLGFSKPSTVSICVGSLSLSLFLSTWNVCNYYFHKLKRPPKPNRIHYFGQRYFARTEEDELYTDSSAMLDAQWNWFILCVYMVKVRYQLYRPRVRRNGAATEGKSRNR